MACQKVCKQGYKNEVIIINHSQGLIISLYWELPVKDKTQIKEGAYMHSEFKEGFSRIKVSGWLRAYTTFPQFVGKQTWNTPEG